MRCPLCSASLRLARCVDGSNGAFITNGDLVCCGCAAQFPIEDGIPRMLHERLPGASAKQVEVDGWIKIAAHHGWYVPKDQVDEVLPFVSRDLGWTDSVWHANEVSFTWLLHDYARPGLRVLEVGAAKCWGAQHLI